MSITRVALFLLLSCLLAACTSQEEKWLKALKKSYQLTEHSIKKLGQHLDAGHLKNAELLKSYAKVIKTDDPAVEPIISTLAANAITSGPMYGGLIQRLRDVDDQLKAIEKSGNKLTQQQANTLSTELNTLAIAARTNNFDGMLIDPINVIAGMSKGKLAKVSELAYEGAIKESTTTPTGSELVGNPTYGTWKTDSSGSSFWEFYGQYAFFSSLFDRPVYYYHWSRHRPPSYYHDYGRDYYSSPKQKTNATQAETRTKKQFAKSGKSFQSPYAKKVSSSTAAKKTSKLATPSKFKSSYASTTKSTSTGSKSFSSTKKSSSVYSSKSSTSSRSFSRGGK